MGNNKCRKHRKLTGDEIAFIKEKAPSMPRRDACRALGMTREQLKYYARKFGAGLSRDWWATPEGKTGKLRRFTEAERGFLDRNYRYMRDATLMRLLVVTPAVYKREIAACGYDRRGKHITYNTPNKTKRQSNENRDEV